MSIKITAAAHGGYVVIDDDGIGHPARSQLLFAGELDATLAFVRARFEAAAPQPIGDPAGPATGAHQ